MLIVVMVIGVLAAAIIPRMINTQARARDVKRKLDLHLIFDANEIYKGDHGTYMLAGNCDPMAEGFACGITSTNGDIRKNNFSGLMEAAPMDPLNNVKDPMLGDAPYIEGNHTYFYGFYLVTDKKYNLVANLENPDDPERCELKHYTYYSDNRQRCPPDIPRRKTLFELSPRSNP